RSTPVRPSAFSGKRLDVHGDPRIRHGDDADRAPAVGELGERREGGDQGVVFATGEHPVQGVRAEGRADFGEPGGDVEVGGADVDADAGGFADVAEVGEQ